MKNIFILLLAFLPLLASAQTPEIMDIQQEVVLDGGNYYVLTTTVYAEGPPMVVPAKIGNAPAMLAFALNSAVNRQQDSSSVMKRALEEETLSFREFKGVGAAGDEYHRWRYHPIQSGGRQILPRAPGPVSAQE